MGIIKDDQQAAPASAPAPAPVPPTADTNNTQQQQGATTTTAPTPAVPTNTAAPPAPQQQQQQQAVPNTDNTAATTTASSPPAAPTTTATKDPAVAKLETEHAELTKEISRLTKECEDAEKEAQNASLTSGSVKQKVRELSDQVTAATRTRASLKKEHDELTAAVDHGKANTDLNQRSANSKSLIVEYEERLSQLETEDVRSREFLDIMAAQYKRVAERKKTALARARTELAELSAAIKINASDCPLLVRSKDADESTNNENNNNNKEAAAEEEDPAEQLDILADLAANREFDLRDAERQLRETEAIVQLKEQEIVRLQAETAQRLDERRKERDEEIKRMVFGFQDDRKALHDDIAEMRRANADQKLKLVRGHVQESKHSNGDATEVFLQSATRSRGSALPPAQGSVTARRDTHLKPKPKKSIEEAHLEEHNAEIEDSLRAALHDLAEEQKVKSEIAKNTKSIQERVKKDDLMFSQKIMQLKAAAASENARARKAESENEKLCADVSHFSEVLENTRRNIERVRGHSAPLPVE